MKRKPDIQPWYELFSLLHTRLMLNEAREVLTRKAAFLERYGFEPELLLGLIPNDRHNNGDGE